MPTSNWENEDAKVKKIADALFDADCKEAYFVSQNGYPTGEPSDKWTEAQLKKYLSVNSVAWTEEHTKAQLLTKAKAKFGE